MRCCVCVYIQMCLFVYIQEKNSFSLSLAFLLFSFLNFFLLFFFLLFLLLVIFYTPLLLTYRIFSWFSFWWSSSEETRRKKFFFRMNPLKTANFKFNIYKKKNHAYIYIYIYIYIFIIISWLYPRYWVLSILYCTLFATNPQSDLVTTNTVLIYIYIYMGLGH